MTVLVSETRQAARKPHQCDNCGRFIEPGTRYLRQFVKDGGDVWSWVSHEDCAEAAARIWDEYGWRGEPIPPLVDQEQEAFDAYRGQFPHAVCRAELSWQLAENRAEAEMAARKARWAGEGRP